MMSKKLTKKELIEEFTIWVYIRYMNAPFGSSLYYEVVREASSFVETLKKMDGRKKALLIKTIEEKKVSINAMFEEVISRFTLDLGLVKNSFCNTEVIDCGEYDLKVDEYALLYDKTIVKITAWCEECEPREIHFKYRFWDRLKFKRKSAWVRETDIVGYGKTLKGAKRVRKLLKKEKPYVFRKKSKVKEGENDESI